PLLLAHSSFPSLLPPPPRSTLFPYTTLFRSHPTLRDVQQKLADVATVAEENIVGVHVVKAFAQEPAEEEKFRERSEAVFRQTLRDRKSTRLNSSHLGISYAVFCLKKKNKKKK